MSDAPAPVLKKLGVGWCGTVYVDQTAAGEPCILKVERLPEAQMKPDLRYPLWRMIEFNRAMALKHPDCFLTLESYEIRKDATFRQEKTEWFHSELNQETDRMKWEDLDASPYVSRLKYVPVCEEVLGEVRSELRAKGHHATDMDLFCRQIHVLVLLAQAGWVHRDTHDHNWMMKGPALYLIDYGQMTHVDFPLAESADGVIEYPPELSEDIIASILYFLADRPIEDWISQHEWKTINGTPNWARLLADPVYRSLADRVDAQIPHDSGTYQDCIRVLFRLHAPLAYYQAWLGDEQAATVQALIAPISDTQRDLFTEMVANLTWPTELLTAAEKLKATVSNQ